ncbi:glycoside hydrolase superfamily [Aspergillus karnatakaensis]|uniref:glycoside hydrolase superfamily n=1 Tax=Aspergillus karnatakaensis TaxID=1810916 RepID=UPI003CCE2240
MTVSIEKWWKNSIIYQIYPASFKDSNGDGIGDLRGILSELDYIASLGVDAIWICPMYDSPQYDMGYDISDYQKVYPPYGTVEDMQTLINACHARGLKIILDLVVNHTSHEHAWFKESRSAKTSSKRNWYVWRPARYDANGKRQPPNNWRSIFGGSAWEWDETTQEYYLHLFCVEQPDLNWENPEVRQTIYSDAMEFWLKKGVDGFRVDTVNMYSKDPSYPDAPVLTPESDTQVAFSLFCNGPRIHEYLKEMNEVLEKYDAMTVGELAQTPTMEGVLRYVSAAQKQLNMVFSFDVVDLGMGKDYKFQAKKRNWALPELKTAIQRTQSILNGTDGWTTVFMENHDQARSVSRFGSDKTPELRDASAKMLAIFQSTLSGTQFVYQGQEIGMVNVPEEWGVEEYKDVDSTNYYHMVREMSNNNSIELKTALQAMQHLARDHARIPMQWSTEPNAGFTTPAAKPWMRAHDNHLEVNVRSQEKNPSSVLSFWKRMTRLRKENADLFVFGIFELLDEQNEHVFSYVKTAKGRSVLVALNFSEEQQEVKQIAGKDLRLLMPATEQQPPRRYQGIKACDPCRRRKVRCNGHQRCQQCEHLDLRCTYTENKDARSRKNALRRGTHISEYKSSSTQNAKIEPVQIPTLVVGPASPPDLSVPLSTAYLHNLIPKYMEYVYRFNPIMTSDEICESIAKMEADRDHAAFVYVFTAVTIDLTQSNVSASHVSEQIQELTRRAVEIRTPLLPGIRPCILRAITSVYIQMCYMSLGQYDLGFFYLREAISMLHLLRIDDKSYMASLDLTERSRRQRLYWLCFIHERFMSIVHFSSATLSPYTEFPEDDPALGPFITQGWTQVIKTFLLLEPTFISLWIGDRTQVTVAWVEQKNRELDDELWELEVSLLTEMQQADLVVTRQWMRTLLWQMAMSNCLLSSNASCPSLSLEMPLRLSTQLRQFLTKISQNTIQIHGSSILSKLLEILNTIADVVIHGPQVSVEETMSRIDDIVFMKNVIVSFRNLQHISKEILVEKMMLIRERFPMLIGDQDDLLAI